MMEVVFYTSVFVLVFVYALYGPIMMIVRRFIPVTSISDASDEELPSVSLIIPAFNEEGWIKEKIDNSLSLSFPEEKFELIVVTDGSTDRTPEIAKSIHPDVLVIHEPTRGGKIKAMDRAAKIAKNEILIFTDANTIVNKEALKYIAQRFLECEVGMVSGEKKVIATKEGESASGEGVYWKYESWLKKLDSDVASVIGAAGELFAIRSDLYTELPGDTLLDDFMLSSEVIKKGFKVAYVPEAYATEYGSESYKEEWKRKVRICAGGMQSIARSAILFNILRYKLKSFSFTFHRASRWTIAPLALLLSYLTSAVLMNESILFALYFLGESVALLLTYHSVQKNEKNLPKPLLLVVYFTFMHASAIAGWFRYFSGNQTVQWERALRIVNN